MVTLELGKRQIITGMIGALAGCFMGFIAGNYFPFYGGMSVMSHYGSPARDALVRGHMALGCILLGSIGVVMPRFFARAMFWFGCLLVVLIAIALSLVVIEKVAEAKERKKQQQGQQHIRDTINDALNGKLWDDEDLIKRGPNEKPGGRIWVDPTTGKHYRS